MSQSNADLDQAAAALSRIASLTAASTTSIDPYYKELEGPKRRDALNGIARELQSFAESMVHETGQLSYFQERALNAMARSLLIANEDGILRRSQVSLLEEKVNFSADALADFSATLRTTRQTLLKMPRATRALNIAKRNACGAIDLLVSKLEEALRIQSSIQETLRSLPE